MFSKLFSGILAGAKKVFYNGTCFCFNCIHHLNVCIGNVFQW